jgi:hypothetical protein
MLLESCESRSHQGKTPWEQLCRQGARDHDHRANPAPVSRWRKTDTPREQIAEAAEAREPDLHTDVGDRMVSQRQQMLGAIEPCLDPVLVRCIAKQRAELPNEVKRRHRRFARHILYGERTIVDLAQHVASAAQAREGIIGEH